MRSANAFLTREIAEEKWQKHQKKLLGWDSYFTIDMALMSIITGTEGLKRVHAKILAVLPSSGKPKSIDAALEELKTLERGDLCMYSGAQAKGDIAMAVQTLSEIQGKMMPARVANPTSFVQSLWLRLPFFATLERVVAEGSEETKELLMGQAAVNAMWLMIKSKADADIEQHEVDTLGVWAWLLTQEEREELHNLSMRLLVSRQATPAKRVLKGADQRTSKKSKHKQEPENSAAMAFLGVK
eukprot:6492650-Amphidinium_carterae.1